MTLFPYVYSLERHNIYYFYFMFQCTNKHEIDMTRSNLEHENTSVYGEAKEYETWHKYDEGPDIFVFKTA